MKEFLTVFVVLLCLFQASGQTKFSYGIEISPSIEKKVWLGDYWIYFRNKGSLNFELKFNYSLYKNFQVETGLGAYDKG